MEPAHSTTDPQPLRKKSIYISYGAGLASAILVLLWMTLTPSALSGPGPGLMMFSSIYTKAYCALFFAFLFALKVGGVLVYKDTLAGQPLIFVSVKYSLAVNLITWIAFIAVAYFDNIGNESMIITLSIMPGVIGFVVCIMLTPLTIGLLVSYLARRAREKRIVYQPDQR